MTADSLAAIEGDVVVCRACPRLVAWREEVARRKVARFSHETYWGAPVPGFGDPGDCIVVEERNTAQNGDTVVAVVDNQATVKRFFREKSGRIRLQPANSRMQPIFVKDRDLEIRGVVVAVLRKYR